jgi:hypothetical protein
LLLGVFKTFLAIWALKVITEGTFDSSPTLFFVSFDSPSTWEFLHDVWELWLNWDSFYIIKYYFLLYIKWAKLIFFLQNYMVVYKLPYWCS